MGIHFHQHDQGHDHEPSDIPRVLTRALIVTAAFMGIELVGGILANSLALVSDSAHMLMDVGALLLSLFAYWITRRPSTPSMSFGYHRAEILGAVVSGLLIWLVSGLLIYEAILRLRNPPEVQGAWVFGVALVGLAANLLSMGMLHRSSHASMNVRAAYLHLLSDALGSVGVVISGAVIWFTGWRPIDPIMTLAMAVLMLASSWKLMTEAIGVLMEGAPRGVDPARVQGDLTALPGVIEVHDLHIWTVSTGRLALSVHLISAGQEAILAAANDVLKQKHGIVHTTIQVEHPERFQSERCYDCGR
jgi:cobalt-zinc-cadmium efflux system protein